MKIWCYTLLHVNFISSRSSLVRSWKRSQIRNFSATFANKRMARVLHLCIGSSLLQPSSDAVHWSDTGQWKGPGRLNKRTENENRRKNYEKNSRRRCEKGEVENGWRQSREAREVRLERKDVGRCKNGEQWNNGKPSFVAGFGPLLDVVERRRRRRRRGARNTHDDQLNHRQDWIYRQTSSNY